jgi:hypothetical protein
VPANYFACKSREKTPTHAKGVKAQKDSGSSKKLQLGDLRRELKLARPTKMLRFLSHLVKVLKLPSQHLTSGKFKNSSANIRRSSRNKELSLINNAN